MKAQERVQSPSSTPKDIMTIEISSALIDTREHLDKLLYGTIGYQTAAEAFLGKVGYKFPMKIEDAVVIDGVFQVGNITMQK